LIFGGLVLAISARLLPPSGTQDHSSCGEVYEPSQEWRAGIEALCVSDGDLLFNNIPEHLGSEEKTRLLAHSSF